MENNKKKLKKQCPICGIILDASVDYCPNCDSYVGDVSLLQEKPVDNLTGKNLDAVSQENTNHIRNDFEKLDTIINENKKDQSKITLDQLKKILSANGEKITSDDLDATNNDLQFNQSKSSITPLVNDKIKSESLNKSVPKRGHHGFLFKEHKEKTSISNKNNHQVSNNSKISKSISSKTVSKTNNADKDVIYASQQSQIRSSNKLNLNPDQKKTNNENSSPPFFGKLGEFVLNSFKHPSKKVRENLGFSWIFVFGLEIVLIVFSVQLIYNSGFQMVHSQQNPQWGKAIMLALTIGKKYTILWPLLCILGIYFVSIISGLFVNKFLIRAQSFSVNCFLNQVARWSIAILPLSILVFIYSLFNNPLVTKISLVIITLIPELLVLAVVLYIIQLRGNLVCDRIYLILGYNIFTIVIDYGLLYPYLINFVQAFNSLTF